jgi:ABC-type transport system substrate-binding protein
MKFLMVTSAVAAIALAQAAFAQKPTTNPQATQQQPTSNPSPSPAAAQQIQQDLKKAGFTDVKVVAESFVVQAKSKDGNPVVMTIGPQGMSVFEAMSGSPGSNSQSGTTGQAGSQRGTKF